MLAQQKQQVIKDAFANWIWQDPQRRIALVKQYNELFNSNRPREYDGSHIHFVGMNPEISLREHQRNAIAHVLYGGNTLLAHEVGAGKTFEMAASAMEAKRLGLCQKSLFVVPNHLTEQWASEFLHLYPNAKLLVARKKDFETANRKKFCARIATGDYDAVIIGHSQFERIPLSYERQERIIQEQIDETLAAINELKATAGENFSIKQMEKTRKTLEIKLEKLRSDARKDDVITFEQLGVDRLFVDESHFYKNLFLTTKMRNVAGLSTSEAQKSSDMFGKCRYLDEITGGRGVVFATGTPVSNSMSELYTVMRYLQYGTLQQKGLTHFDCWAFLDALEQQGYEVKRGKHPSVKGKGQRRFIRFRTLGAGYTEEEIKTVLDGKAEHQPHPKQPLPEKKFGLLVDIPTKMAEGKTSGYKKWATKFNLKEMSKTLLYLQEKKIDSADELRERAAAATERYHTLGDSIKAAEKRMGEIAVLRAHIVNYAKTRDAYAAYRKAGYSKKFLEAHREEIELHKAAKAAFDEADLKKLPKVKDLNVEYSELLSQKKIAYPEYRKAKEEMQELVRAQKNVERFFAEEKQMHETEQVR